MCAQWRSHERAASFHISTLGCVPDPC
jgi:hypothetical protein